jgi:hypothetical protein
MTDLVDIETGEIENSGILGENARAERSNPPNWLPASSAASVLPASELVIFTVLRRLLRWRRLAPATTWNDVATSK